MNAFAVLKEAWKQRHSLGHAQKSAELTAFLPAALEIQETPPNPLTQWLARTLLLLFGIAILWAYFGHVDIVASAEGKIIPSSRVKVIQPSQKGIVKTIWVNEGDYVTQGQALIELDTTLTRADKNRLKGEMHTLLLSLAVNERLLQQIQEHKDTHTLLENPEQDRSLLLSPPPDAKAQEIALYQQLLWHQWQQYWSTIQTYKSSLRKNQAQQAASNEVIRKLTQLLPIATKKVDNLQNLYAQNFVSETEYLQAQQEQILTTQDLAAEKQRYQQFVAEQSEIREQLNTHIAQTSSQLLSQIADQKRQINTLQEELIKATDLNDKQVLYAPVAGRVQELTINTIGGVVTEAQQLMLIIPSAEQLEVEVFLANKDIGFVQENMPAEIKVHTFPFTKYGVIDATVVNVSNDAIVDEQRGLIYSMQLTLEKSTINVQNETVNLMPGMAVTAEVKTGTRRIIEFFLAPLLRAKNESIRER